MSYLYKHEIIKFKAKLTWPCFHFLIMRRFRYKFKADTVGSMFYHSHSSFQRGDGLFGPYIVRTNRALDPNGDEYDLDLTEHYIHVQEWFHKVKLN